MSLKPTHISLDAHDRSGPLERAAFDGKHVPPRNFQVVPLGVAIQPAPKFYHQYEHNPFDASFEGYAASSPSPPDMQQKRSRPDGPSVPLQKKRPKILQDEGSNNAPSSYTTAQSTESSNDGQDSPAIAAAGGQSDMSRSTSQPGSEHMIAPVPLARSLPLDYEALVRNYAQSQAAKNMQPAPKALPANAVPTYRAAPIVPETVVVEPRVHNGNGSAQSGSNPLPALADRDLASLPRKTNGRKGSKAPKTVELAPAAEADDDEDKRAQFLERNRVAACKSRQKKKEWIASLETTSEELTRKNSEMQHTVNTLREEVSTLRAALAAHQNCDCASVHSLKGSLGKACLPQHMQPVQQPMGLAVPQPQQSQPMQMQHSHNGMTMVSPSTIQLAGNAYSPSAFRFPNPPSDADYFSQANQGTSQAFSTPELASQLGF